MADHDPRTHRKQKNWALLLVLLVLILLVYAITLMRIHANVAPPSSIDSHASPT